MLEIGTIALFTAALSLFWDMLLQPEMILGHLKEKIADMWLSKYNPYTPRPELIPEDQAYDKYDKVTAWWWKPTIGCVLCFNVWISVVTVSALSVGVADSIFVIVLSSVMTRFANEHI